MGLSLIVSRPQHAERHFFKTKACVKQLLSFAQPGLRTHFNIDRGLIS